MLHGPIGDPYVPEFSEKVQVPYRTVKHQYFCHVVQGYLPIFKIPRFPRGDLPSLHTLDGTRTERAASALEPRVTRADDHQSPVSPNVPLRRHNGLVNFPTRSTLSQWRKGHERAETFKNRGLFIMGAGEHKRAELDQL